MFYSIGNEKIIEHFQSMEMLEDNCNL